MGVDMSCLLEILGKNDYYMCTGEELAVLMNFSKDVMSRIKSDPDSPFFLGKARPEWISAWMKDHPEFQLSKAVPMTPKRERSSVNKRTGRKYGELRKAA